MENIREFWDKVRHISCIHCRVTLPGEKNWACIVECLGKPPQMLNGASVPAVNGCGFSTHDATAHGLKAQDMTQVRTISKFWQGQLRMPLLTLTEYIIFQRNPSKSNDFPLEGISGLTHLQAGLAIETLLSHRIAIGTIQTVTVWTYSRITVIYDDLSAICIFRSHIRWLREWCTILMDRTVTRWF